MAKAEARLLGQAGRTTVAKYLGWWMENVVRGEVAHRTYHNYLSQIRNHIVPRLGKKKLNTLELEDVEVMYRSMMTSGLSSATIRYVHAVLRSLEAGRRSWTNYPQRRRQSQPAPYRSKGDLSLHSRRGQEVPPSGEA